MNIPQELLGLEKMCDSCHDGKAAPNSRGKDIRPSLFYELVGFSLPYGDRTREDYLDALGLGKD